MGETSSCLHLLGHLQLIPSSPQVSGSTPSRYFLTQICISDPVNIRDGRDNSHLQRGDVLRLYIENSFPREISMQSLGKPSMI